MTSKLTRIRSKDLFLNTVREFKKEQNKGKRQRKIGKSVGQMVECRS